jgi:hypothetical protein
MAAWALIAVSTLAFAGLCTFAWNGKLGFLAIGLLLVSSVTWFAGHTLLRRGKVNPKLRERLSLVGKMAFTFGGIMALLRHRIKVELPLDGPATDGMQTVSKVVDGQEILYQVVYLPIYDAIASYITQVDPQTFLMWAMVAMCIKFVGVIASAFGWNLLLRGQGVRYPFWSKIMTAFLIGRFIGTFLPSTLGLDGYTLYEAGKYSNQWARVITAKGLEKFIGVTGLFLGMLLTLPFGYQVIVDVTTTAGQPEAAPVLAGLIGGVAGSISLVIVLGLIWPPIIVFFVRIAERIAYATVGRVGFVLRILNRVGSFPEAVGAYRGKLGILMGALVAKFITHFTTFAVYYFTALAIGVIDPEFWPIVFGSSIQVLATLFSPTIAGEGAREAVQALMLEKQLGGVAQAVLSGALGFIAAEAATMWGGAFLLTRKPGWRPAFAEVDGQQVDYAWIDDSEDTGFDAQRIAQARARHQDGEG